MIDVFFQDFLMELVPVFLEMQVRGVRVDPWRRRRLRQEYKTKQLLAAKRLETFAGMPIMGKKTIATKALLFLLYEKLRFPRQYHHRTKKLTADKRALQKLSTKVDDKKRAAFTDILTVRDLSVLISTFLDARLDDDNQLRWSHNLAGTVSGRISTSASPFFTGTNIQNWEESVRDMVIPDPEYLMVYADGEQAEARVVAFLSQDPAFMKVFSSGINVHKQIANLVFKTPIDKVDKSSPQYHKAKTVVHAADYKVGVNTAAMIIGCSVKEAKVYLHDFHQLFPGVRANFHNTVEDSLRRRKILFTPFGRWRQFFGRMDDDLIRAGISYIPQSTVADWLDMGLLRLNRLLTGNLVYGKHNQLSRWLNLAEPSLPVPSTLYPSIQIHDGLACFVHHTQLREAISLIHQALTFPIPFQVGPLTIPIDIKVGYRWGSLHPVDSVDLDQLIRGDYEHLMDLDEEEDECGGPETQKLAQSV